MTSGLHSQRVAKSRWLIYAVAIILCLSPVASESLWWNVCRGRAVCGGSWTSAAQMIQQEQRHDSDCLSGIIPWVVFDALGFDGLMFLKLCLGLVVGRLLAKNCRVRNDDLIVTGMLVACSPAFDPDHAMFDLLGILIAWRLAGTGRKILLSLLTVVWCNYSIAAIWCLPVVLVRVSDRDYPANRRWLMVLWVLLALCVNLRGPMAIVEMLRVAVPGLFYDLNLLSHAGFGPLSLNIPAVSAMTLCLCAMLHSRCSLAARPILLLCGLAAILNFNLLPYAAMIGGLAVLSFRHASAGQAAKASEKAQVAKTTERLFRWGASFGLAATVLILVSGGINGQSERLGWGVADLLDIRLTERDLQNYTESSLLAHASDTNSAGLLMMALPKSRVVDVAETAIKRGRFHDFAMLNYDLSTGRKTAYARSDGNMGGWWNSLINGKVDLLMISADHLQIFSALEPTLWKPLALDSPGIVLGQAGSSKFTRQIIDVIDQRDLVDFGGWQHQLSATVANRSHTDFWQLLTGIADGRADIRQARVFRSMGMYNAAARTILPVVRERCRPLGMEEFQKIQQELAWQEQLHCGSVSQWRLQVLNFLKQTSPHGFASLNSNPASPPSLSVEFAAEAIRLFCDGQPELAAELIVGDDPDSLFALHSLYWQAGNIQDAERVLLILRSKHSDHPVTLAAEWECGSHQQQ